MYLLIFALAIVIAVLIIVIYIAHRKILKEKTDELNIELNEKTDLALVQYDKIADSLNDKTPIHLGIIPDGNRRWRKKHKCDVYDYINKIKELITSLDSNLIQDPKYKNLALVNALSIYILSKDNLTKRNDDTMTMIKECLNMINGTGSTDNNWMPWDRVRIQFVGELQELPPDILELCKQISAKGSGTFVITAAIGYDPIADAAKITNEKFSPNEMFDPTGLTRPLQRDIDLVFRSGGELRASGFFPLQTLYSEWVYTPTLFPDVTVDDINIAVGDFLQRKRNFGQ